MLTRRLLGNSIFPSAVAAAATLAPALALAGTLVSPQLRSRPIVRPHTVQNGLLKTNAPVLGIRTPKARGGYTLNPVCLANGKVYVGTVEYQYSKFRVACPFNGKTIYNGSDYVAEDGHMIRQRGRLSTATLTYRMGTTGKRVICYGRVGNNVVPGWMDEPDPGTVPAACNVEVFGQSFAATDYGVFKYKDHASLPATEGWWTMSNTKVGESDIPLTAFKLPIGGGYVCRAKQGSIYYPGTVIESAGNYRCQARTPNGPVSMASFSLYIAPRRNPQPALPYSTSLANSHNYGRGLNVNNSSMPVYLCKQYGTKLLGYVIDTPSARKCVVNTTNASKQPPNMGRFSLLRRY